MVHVSNAVPSVVRSVEADKVEVDKKRRTIRAIVNDDSVDRYGTIIWPDGIDTIPYMNTGGPVLHEHGRSAERGTFPVGNTVEIGPIRRGGRSAMTALVRFWEADGGDEFPERLWRAYSTKRMRSFSVNVRPFPQHTSPPTRDELRARPDAESCSMIFRSSELLELSTTSVAGNANANAYEVNRHLAGASPVLTRAQLEDYSAAYRQIKRMHERAVVGWYRTIGGGLVDYASFKNLSVEDLEKEIKRLRLMCELCELMGKMADKEKWAAEAALIEVEKQALAAGTGRK